MPILKEWKIIYDPCWKCNVLAGYVYGDVRFEDGTYIHTSILINLDLQHKRAQTENILYILGEEAK